jgi:enediyne biosynthesis protein E4
MPVFLKREITDQFPGLKKQNLKHSEYARKTIQELFGKEAINKSTRKEFNYCSSVIAINGGEGKFKVLPLPQMVQLSSVNAVEVLDINGDGMMDLLAGGNRFVYPPQFGRLDASYGHVLINKGQGNYQWIEPAQSGINIKDQVRSIKKIKGTNNLSYTLWVSNNQLPVLYKIK